MTDTAKAMVNGDGHWPPPGRRTLRLLIMQVQQRKNSQTVQWPHVTAVYNTIHLSRVDCGELLQNASKLGSSETPKD